MNNTIPKDFVEVDEAVFNDYTNKIKTHYQRIGWCNGIEYTDKYGTFAWLADSEKPYHYFLDKDIAENLYGYKKESST